MNKYRVSVIAYGYIDVEGNSKEEVELKMLSYKGGGEDIVWDESFEFDDIKEIEE